MSRTLRVIRQDAPATDREAAALTPSDKPHWAKGRDGSRFVFASIHPRDCNELRKLSREFGEAAVTEVQWSCVILWLMNSLPETVLRNPVAVACLAVGMVRERDRIHLNWPTFDGAIRPPSLLAALGTDVRGEAELVALETLLDWERAGKPHLGWRTIKHAYRYLIACPAFNQRYVRASNEKEQK